MNYLIDKQEQIQIARLVDSAVSEVLSRLTNHGSEEGITSALGQALMGKKISTSSLVVEFNYRQHNKITEEPHSGADGAFVVRVRVAGVTTDKAALFQAKWLRQDRLIPDLSLSAAETKRLAEQSGAMRTHTPHSIIVFYTHKNIYVVDAANYKSYSTYSASKPLDDNHRLITLGTYLGKWLPRCTRGDTSPDLMTRVLHAGGFRHGITLTVASKSPRIEWED